jgi:small subunit ribosomal protein S6
MTLPAPTYDLVLLLDPQAEPAARAKIVADTRGSIEAEGQLVRHDEWGERALSYPIDRHSSAEYHLLQFQPAATALLDGLDRTLRITDGVLRFRIIKLKPGTPAPPDMGAGAARESPPAETPGPAETPAPADPQAQAETPAPADPQAPVGEPA